MTMLQAFGRWIAARIPAIGQFVNRADDDDSSGWPRNVTPEQLISAMQRATDGDPDLQNEIFLALLEAVPSLRGIYETRKQAVHCLPWEIVPTDETNEMQREPDPRAIEAAEYCAEVLANIPSFEPALEHLSDAVGFSIAVVECVYRAGSDGLALSYFVPVAQGRLLSAPRNATRLHIRTDAQPTVGVPVSDEPLKWIVHRPFGFEGSLFRGGLLRSVATLALMHRYAFSWWATDLESFGSPTLLGKYGTNATEADREKFMKMARDTAVNRVGLFSEDFQLDTVERKSSPPHRGFLEWVQEQFAINLLGQTLTTKVGDTGGAYAAAKVHEQVRIDILKSDLRKEARSLRHLLAILTGLRFGPEWPVPYWHRIIEKDVNLVEKSQLIGLGRGLGLRPTLGWVSNAVGVPLGPDQNPDDPIEDAPSPLASLPFTFDDSRQRALPAPGNAQPERLTAAWQTIAVKHAQAQVRAVLATPSVAAKGAKSLQDAKRMIASALEKTPMDSMTDAVYRFLLAVQMYGMWNARIKVAKKRATIVRAAFAEPNLEPFGRTFEEAVRALQDRLKLPPDKFLSLDAAARSRAGRIAGQFNMRMVQDVYGVVEKSIEKGLTMRDFKKLLADMPEAAGWLGDDPAHVQLVFNQNRAMSYAAGHYQGLKEADVKRWQFEVRDEACPICEPLDGLIFDIADTKFYPPVHFQCNCDTSPVWEDETKFEDVTSADDIKNAAYDESQQPAGAFKWEPGSFAKLEPLDLSAVPSDLKSKFREFAESHGWQVKG